MTASARLAVTSAPGGRWSPRSRPGSRRARTAAFPGSAGRKSPCSRASAPTTTCGWSAAATGTPRRRSSNRSRGSCTWTTSSWITSSAWPPRARGRRGGGSPNACPRGCITCWRACGCPRSWKGARSMCSPPTGSPAGPPPASRPAPTLLRRRAPTPEGRHCHEDWTRSAEGFIAAFRKSAGDDIDNPRLVELVGELALSSERFRTLWARHEVRGLDGGTTTVHHPVVGDLRLHRDKLPVGDVLLVLYYADHGSESDEKLRLLASMAQAAPASVEPLTRADRLPGC